MRGLFTDDAAGRAAMQAARAEWNSSLYGPERYWKPGSCRSVATPIKPLELEDVEPGDGDRVDAECFHDDAVHFAGEHVGLRVEAWYKHSATDVITQRHEINHYRRPSKSNRNPDLGGPAEAAGVLYVLTVKAPK